MTAKLRLLNTMTRSIESFESLEQGQVRIYTCGPTIYDYSHIGNFRTFLFEDILRRTVKGIMQKLVLGLTTFGNVCHGACDAAKLVVEVVKRHALAKHPKIMTLLVPDPEFQFEFVDPAFSVVTEVAVDFVKILRMDPG